MARLGFCFGATTSSSRRQVLRSQNSPNSRLSSNSIPCTFSPISAWFSGASCWVNSLPSLCCLGWKMRGRMRDKPTRWYGNRRKGTRVILASPVIYMLPQPCRFVAFASAASTGEASNSIKRACPDSLLHLTGQWVILDNEQSNQIPPQHPLCWCNGAAAVSPTSKGAHRCPPMCW